MVHLPHLEALRYFIEDRQRMFRCYDGLAEKCAETMAELLSMEKRLEKMRRRSVGLTNRCAKALKCLCGYVFGSFDTQMKRNDCVFVRCPRCRSLFSIRDKQADGLRLNH